MIEKFLELMRLITAYMLKARTSERKDTVEYQFGNMEYALINRAVEIGAPENRVSS